MILDEVCELIIDTEHKTAPNVDFGIPSVRTPNIGKGRLILDKDIKYVDESTFFEWTKRAIPQKNDLIIAREAPVGNVALVPDIQLCLGQRTVLARPDIKKVSPYFLCYYLLSPKIQYKMLAGSGGSTVAHLNMKDIRNLELEEIPPLPTQRRIASILSAYDDLIENNLKRIKLLEEKAFLRYKGIVKSEELEKTSVFDYAEIMSGGTPSTTNPNYWEGEIPFFTPKDLSYQSGYYLDDTERKLTELGLEKCNSRLFPRDTIFITARGTVGKLVLAKVPSAISQSNYAITTRNGSSNYFLFLALIDKIDHLKQLAVGGVFDTIIVDTFKMIFIELPNQAIINQFNIKIKPIFQLIDTLQKQNTKLREARDILLPKLMSGQIEV